MKVFFIIVTFLFLDISENEIETTPLPVEVEQLECCSETDGDPIIKNQIILPNLLLVY